MIAEIRPDVSWRRPGCGDGCQAVMALIIGQAFKSRLVLHSPESHELWGRDEQAADMGIREWGIVRTGGIEVNRLQQSVSVYGVKAPLTVIETKIMLYLANQVGLPCTYYDVLRIVWGDEYVPPEPYAGSMSGMPPNTVADRDVLRSHLSRLRAELGPCRDLLETLPSIGLRLALMPPLDDLP